MNKTPLTIFFSLLYFFLDFKCYVNIFYARKSMEYFPPVAFTELLFYHCWQIVLLVPWKRQNSGKHLEFRRLEECLVAVPLTLSEELEEFGEILATPDSWLCSSLQGRMVGLFVFFSVSFFLAICSHGKRNRWKPNLMIYNPSLVTEENSVCS